MEHADTILSQLFTNNSRQLKYERGDVIIRSGDTPSGVYLITKGWVDMYNLCQDGEQNIIMCMKVGDIFPLEWLISDTLHEVSFAALEPTDVSRMPRDLFSQKFRASAEIAQAVAYKLSYCCAQLSSELEHLSYRSARERVAFRLVSLATWPQQPESETVTLGLRIPNEYIARSTNMTRETASREISWLIKKGFIERQNGYLVIKNLPGLRREIGRDF